MRLISSANALFKIHVDFVRPLEYLACGCGAVWKRHFEQGDLLYQPEIIGTFCSEIAYVSQLDFNSSNLDRENAASSNRSTNTGRYFLTLSCNTESTPGRFRVKMALSLSAILSVCLFPVTWNPMSPSPMWPQPSVHLHTVQWNVKMSPARGCIYARPFLGIIFGNLLLYSLQHLQAWS